jgi:drug/metabolite transporter (DMT)-like permease
MRWLGVPVYDRSERHKGPCGPHPRAKIPEGKVDTDYVSLETSLVIHRVPSCHSCLDRARHLELPGQAGVAKQTPHLVFKSVLFLLATGVLHLLYTESLLRGYRAGDLTMVYPLARGTGPLLSFLGAVVLLHEQLSLLAASGAVLISVGILLASGGFSALRDSRNHAGIFWGVATGCTIASYTLVDGYSVKTLLLSPILVDYAGNLFRLVVLSSGAYRRRSDLLAEYSQWWREATGIGILTPIGYILVLFAMRLAPISHVAPVREMSMMIGMYFGARFLREGHIIRRLIGSAFIVGGVAALALG